MEHIRINEDRLRKELDELVRIDSVSFGERQMADRLRAMLEEIGFTVEEDNAGEAFGGNAGNLFARLPGTLDGAPILLSGHMDTVQPGLGKCPVFHEDGTVTSRGDTVLGADNLAGVLEILEGVRATREAGLPHRNIELLLSIAEEVYTKGSAVFDYTKISAKEAYVLDVSGPIGTAVLKSPSFVSFTIKVHGKAAHAGFEPENGIHAIQIASRAIAALPMGHADPESTLNIGLISGGSVTNAVPELCTCRGEIRSFRHERALELLELVRQTFEDAANDAGASVELTSQTDAFAFETPETSPAATHFRDACETLSIPWRYDSTFGGSDANWFAVHGIESAVLSCGMYSVHSIREYTTIPDLINGAKVVSELIRHPAEA